MTKITAFLCILFFAAAVPAADGIYLFDRLDPFDMRKKETGYWDLAWHARLADYGDKDSQYILGQAYEEGVYTEKNIVKSIAFYKKAAQQYHIESAMRLGQIYGEGELVEPDPAQSLFWYELAAKNGHAPAQIKLSEIYMQQTPPDYEKSYEWQEKAMKQLFPESPDLLAVSPKLRELKELIDNAKQSQTPAPDIKNEND